MNPNNHLVSSKSQAMERQTHTVLGPPMTMPLVGTVTSNSLPLETSANYALLYFQPFRASF